MSETFIASQSAQDPEVGERSAPAHAILNIAGYRFVAIDDSASLGRQLLEACRALDLRGTILIAPEGINFFLAGQPSRLRTWLDELSMDPRFRGLTTRQSWSATQPFGKMRVRIKSEIIRMNRPELVPAAGRARAVMPTELERWLDQTHDDEGRPIVLLDTRNAFEVDYGAFRGARSLGLQRFSEFPERVRPHVDAWRSATVVSYCTGGIRCEKAGLFLAALGLEHSVQLEGGILAYFDTVGAKHFDGSCFVFDEREALDPALAPIGGSWRV